jgi:phospholipase A1
MLSAAKHLSQRRTSLLWAVIRTPVQPSRVRCARFTVPRRIARCVGATILGVLLGSALAAPALGEESPFDGCTDDPLRKVVFHKLNYFMLGTYDFVAPPESDEALQGYERDRTETQFQISLKLRTLESFPLFLGYTQKSFWQVYNKAQSAPFRETNYNPEAFVDCQGPFGAPRAFGIRLGVEHESNGQTIARSRSWNRNYVWPRYAVTEKFGLSFKYWQRWPEPDKTDPEQPDGDDNPRIDSYLGRFELYLDYVADEWHEWRLMARKGTRDDSGTYEATYLLHLTDKSGPGKVFAMLHYFSGFGESLIDYDHRVEKWGLGIAFR